MSDCDCDCDSFICDFPTDQLVLGQSICTHKLVHDSFALQVLLKAIDRKTETGRRYWNWLNFCMLETMAHSCTVKLSSDDDMSALTKPESTVVIEEYISPFIKYEDGYPWPDLFTEIDECIESNLLMYPLAELCTLARRHDTEATADATLQLPITHVEALRLIGRNKNNLNSQIIRSFIETCEARQMLRIAPKGFEPIAANMTPASIIAFDDEISRETMACMVTVNHFRRKVIVCFCHTDNDADWTSGFQADMKKVPNPLSNYSKQESTFRVHHKVHSYLFGNMVKGMTSLDGKLLSTYEALLQLHITPVLQRYKRYKLYFTGHGIGAAAATMFGFFIATERDDKIPKPVTVISVGSPYVGDTSFRSAHQSLESQGRLRHLRVSNYRDYMTLSPMFSWNWQLYNHDAHGGAFFKHVGVNLRLYDTDSAFEINFPKVRTGFYSALLDELQRGWEQQPLNHLNCNICEYYASWDPHSLQEYSRRTVSQKPSLRSLNLNDLYARPDLVGNLVAQF